MLKTIFLADKALKEGPNLSKFKLEDDLFKNSFHDEGEVLDSENNEQHSKERGTYLYMERSHYWIICTGGACTSFANRHKEYIKG